MTDSTAENRAQVYWWLSSLIAAELNETQLDQLFGDDMNRFLEALAEESGLQDAVHTFRQAVTALQERADTPLELAADYAQLFLGTAKKGALPYGSVYASDKRLLMQEPHHQMLQKLEENGFARSEGFKEPADHLGIILDFMGNLAIQGKPAEIQRDVLENQLLNWLPEWQQDITRHDPFGFYATVALLIIQFCRVDAEFLKL